MKKFCVLMGSPRVAGNTAELLKPFMAELENLGGEVEYNTLHDKMIESCRSCYACQHVSGRYGCGLADDAHALMDAMLASDCIVWATPVYTWFCTPPMKALLDRTFGLA